MISFEPLRQDHLPLLLTWLNAPHVQNFWDRGTAWTESLVQGKYGTYIEGFKWVGQEKRPLHAFVICLCGEPIGYIQYYDAGHFPRVGYEMEGFDMAALDIFIGEVSALGKGNGSSSIKKLLSEYVWNEFDACFVDPDAANLGAIRAYEKAGFRFWKNVDNMTLMICRREDEDASDCLSAHSQCKR
ncbi:MAG: acetyltransferase [Verrucomicrobia bacterium]|nr:acetyltransferase [Verrucomicrobiota bacterium]